MPPADAAPPARVRRYYRPGTMILCTEFDADTGRVAIPDFMPLEAGHSSVVRIVEGLAGSVAMRMQLDLLGDGHGTPLHSWRLWSESSGFEALTDFPAYDTVAPGMKQKDGLWIGAEHHTTSVIVTATS